MDDHTHIKNNYEELPEGSSLRILCQWYIENPINELPDDVDLAFGELLASLMDKELKKIRTKNLIKKVKTNNLRTRGD